MQRVRSRFDRLIDAIGATVALASVSLGVAAVVVYVADLSRRGFVPYALAVLLLGGAAGWLWWRRERQLNAPVAPSPKVRVPAGR